MSNSKTELIEFSLPIPVSNALKEIEKEREIVRRFEKELGGENHLKAILKENGTN